MFDKNGMWHEPKGTSSGGQFGSSDGMGGIHIATEAEQKRLREIGVESDINNDMSEKFFGEEFKGIRGAEAIEKLLKEQRGHVRNAFDHPDMGGITVVWGDKKGGLSHIIARRNKLLADGVGTISGLEMVKKIPEVINQGEYGIDEKGRKYIQTDKYRIGVNEEHYDKRINWIVTAMEIL